MGTKQPNEQFNPQLEKYFKLPNPGLRAYFQRTEAGNDDDYRPPFWKGQSREEVLAQWQSVLDTLGVKEKYPTLYDYEVEMKGKVGPMSIQKPLEQRLDDVQSYFAGVEGNHIPLSQAAIDATISYFSDVKGLRLRSQRKTAENMRLSTNSGNPWFTKRSRVIEECIGSSIHRTDNNEFYSYIGDEMYHLCAILGWRGQEGGIHDDDVKQRVIWMMSVLLNLNELQLYQPAIEAVQKHNLIPAYVSMDAVDRQVTKLFDTKGAEDLVICTDFSKFDQHFNGVMQSAAEAILRGLCTPSADIDAWFHNVYPAKFHIPIICSSQIAFRGYHGMGSGSGGTNFDECLAHKALQFDACQKIGVELNPYSMAYGDDGILTASHLGVDDVIRAYESHGMVMNPEKQYASKHDCVVLRRWHSTNYRDQNGCMVGVYSTFRALGRLLAQERFYDPEVWGPKQVILRAWSILENCNHSPYFEEFVQFVMSGDKYKLGLELDDFWSDLDHTVKESIDLLPDFLGYTKTNMLGGKRPDGGIKNWRIYKYLNSIRKGGAGHALS